MSDLLYKVSEPRDDWTFEPRPFWRAEDWSFSDDRPHDGLVEDRVLFAGDLDEVSLHLLPHVLRTRVRLDDEGRCARLQALGFSWADGARAVIFAAESDREMIEAFAPTVFIFDRDGFERTPTNEWVSRQPRRALSAETLAFDEAMRRWNVEVIYVPDVEALVQTLRSGRIDHQVQT